MLRKRVLVPNKDKSFRIGKCSSAFQSANCKYKLRYRTNNENDFVELLNKSTSAMQKKLEKERTNNEKKCRNVI